MTLSFTTQEGFRKHNLENMNLLLPILILALRIQPDAALDLL